MSVARFPSGPYGSSPTTRASVQQQSQQTYTTAGTIYNPSTLQPLQAPTRRSRSIKWTTAASSPDLSLLPRSLLHSITGHITSSEQHVTVPRYSPLQQNYDRAINPTRVAMCNDDEVGAQAAGESTTDISEFTHVSEDFPTDENEVDAEEERLQTLMSSMTVKSLHNLASYPNPNQRFAQKALNSQAGRARSSARLSQEDRTSYKPINRASQSSLPHGGVYRFGQSNSPAHGQVESAGANQDTAPESTAEGRAQSLRSTRSQNFYVGNLSYSEVAGGGRQGPAATPAPGTGVPRPLTAGPPGQRQYRPATFLSTMKALNPTHTSVYSPRAKTQTDAFEASPESMNGIKRPFSAAAALEGHRLYAPRQPLYGSKRMMRDEERYYNSYKLQLATANVWDMASPYGAKSPILCPSTLSEGDAAVARRAASSRARGMAKYEEHINELWYSGSRALDQVLTRLDGELRSASIDAGSYSSGLDGCDPVLAMALGSLTRAVEEMSAGPASQVDETMYQIPHMNSGSSQSGSASDTSWVYMHKLVPER